MATLKLSPPGAIQKVKHKPISVKARQRVQKAQVIDYLKRLPIYRWAAKSAGIDEDSLKLWRNADKEFSERCEIAKSEAILRLGGRATPEFILRSADPQTFFQTNKLDITSGGNPLPILGGATHVPTNDGDKKDT